MSAIVISTGVAGAYCYGERCGGGKLYIRQRRVSFVLTNRTTRHAQSKEESTCCTSVIMVHRALNNHMGMLSMSNYVYVCTVLEKGDGQS